MRWRSTSATPCSPASRIRDGGPQGRRLGARLPDDGRSPWYCVRDGALEGLPASKGLPEGVRAWPGTSCAKCFRRADESCGACASRDILIVTLIDFHLDGRSIHSRRILAELNGLQKT